MTEFDQNLTKAFKALNKHKIVAKKNFLCCQNCGQTEIHQNHPQDAIGYVFYHHQDNVNKKEGESFYLAFGSLKPDNTDADTIEVGNFIVETLKQFNINTEWSKTASQRIEVLQ